MRGVETLATYLKDVRELVLAELQEIVPRNRYRPVLYDLMLEYPRRAAKMLRPALCIASCRAQGGCLEAILPTAAVIELYHTAFLIHDDIEDESHLRRGLPTLHREHGIPIAVNVGDAMLALALRPLLDNTAHLGLGKALKILELCSRMALESSEGQALELHWIKTSVWKLSDADYWHLVFKKTCWYTFIAPLLVGGVACGATPARLAQLKRLGTFLGIAFQIQDDILNLTALATTYGKEIGGDLFEGKRTLVLLHALRTSTSRDRGTALEILRQSPTQKAAQDVAWLRELIERTASIDYAQRFADEVAARARRSLEQTADWLPASVHRRFLEELTQYVVQRDR
jgi:geranylgeranyl diphosphate synthase, type II